MSDADSLLADILAAPDADAPRLVYADWLSERGDPRGELITLQVELARPGLDGTRSIELRQRADAILQKHQLAWEGPLRPAGVTCNWRRGFPATIFGTGAQFLAARPHLAQLPLEALSLVGDLKPHVAAIVASPELALFRELELSCGDQGNAATRDWALGDAPFATLVRSQHLRHLTKFVTGWNALHVEALAALAEASWLPNLTELDVRDNPLGPAGIVALAQKPRLSQLRRLDLWHTDVGDAGAAALADADMPALEWLRLEDTRIGPAGAIALGHSPSLDNLRMLSLAHCTIKSDGAAAIACAQHMKALVELRLDRCGIGPEAAVAFAGAVERAGLVTLDLEGNAIGSDGARALGNSQALGSLGYLKVGENQLGAAGVDAFADGKGLPALKQLCIGNNVKSTRVEQWTDWDGSIVGEGYAWEDWRETAARFAGKRSWQID